MQTALATHSWQRTARKLILLPIPVMIIASFLAFLALALAQAAQGLPMFYNFGNYYSDTGFVAFLFWTALTAGVVGALMIGVNTIDDNE